MTHALLEQALEALDTAQALLECSAHHPKILNAYEAIRAELARPESTEITLMRACYEEQKKPAQQERKPAADDEIQRLKSDVAQMRETLDGIYNANPRNWEELSCEFTEFERWAKSRARHSLIKLEASESRVVEAPAPKETP